MIQIPPQDAARAACALLLGLCCFLPPVLAAFPGALFLLLLLASACCLPLVPVRSLAFPARFAAVVCFGCVVCCPFCSGTLFCYGIGFVFDCLPQHYTHPPQCAIFLVQEKVTQGSSKSAEYRAYRRIAPKLLELVIISQPVAQTFCGRLLLQHLSNAAYFDPGNDWPKPIELNATLPIVLEQLA